MQTRMRRTLRQSCLAVVAFLVFPAVAWAAQTYDLVIYGGTSAGVVAAVQARDMGKSVVLIEPSVRRGQLGIRASLKGLPPGSPFILKAEAVSDGKVETVGGATGDVWYLPGGTTHLTRNPSSSRVVIRMRPFSLP